MKDDAKGGKTSLLLGVLLVVLVAQLGVLLVLVSKREPEHFPVQATGDPIKVPGVMLPGPSPVVAPSPGPGMPAAGGPPSGGAPPGLKPVGGPTSANPVPLDLLDIGVTSLKDSPHPLTAEQKKELQPIAKRMEEASLALLREQQAFHAALTPAQQKVVMDTARPDPAQMQLPVGPGGLDPFVNAVKTAVE